MNVRALVLASSLGGALLALAPSARADGFFVTFQSKAGAAITGRVAGAALDANASLSTVTYKNSATGQILTAPGNNTGGVHIEIDDWSTARPLLDALGSAAELTVKVELTMPDTAGAEQVYLVATYGGAHITHVIGNYDANATTKVKETVELVYLSAQVVAPPAPMSTLGKPVVFAHKLPTTLTTTPLVLRRTQVTLRALTPPASGRIDDAYFSAPTLVSGQSRVSTATFDVSRKYTADTLGQQRISTLSAGLLDLGMLGFTKTLDQSMTPKLQAALAATTRFDSSITFVQHNAGGADGTTDRLDLANAFVHVDNFSVGASSTETVKLAGSTLKVTAGGASTTLP